VDESALLTAAARRGVGLEGLSWHRSAAEGPSGLLAGYANLPEAAIAQAVRLLAEAIEEVGA
jgi:GntR family transcriptional regulator/MocR family aminotransferase